MKDKFIKSSPTFFAMIIRTMTGVAAALFILAFFMKAPLGRAADPSTTPNPLKSAWFLLWIQEIVSWSKLMIFLPLILAVTLFFLPFISSRKMSYRAIWFPPELKLISAAAIIIFAVVTVLTIIPYCYRGENWLLHF